MRNKYLLVLSILALAIFLLVITNKLISTSSNKQPLPLIAIASYGPHSSLDESIVGIKKELALHGYIEHQNIEYLIVDVGFDAALIPQMIANIKNKQPKVIISQTTPVAQFAKHAVKDIPLVFTAITDPIAAGLQNISGSSDRQDLRAMLQFSKLLMPKIKRVGLLYSTAETNDLALVNMMKEAVSVEDMQLLSIPIEHSRDVPLRMQAFKDKVDIIYVGVSGVVQPSLPVIAATARKMGIAVFNADSDAVKQGQVLASFGVNYQSVGANAGKIVVQKLRGDENSSNNSIYPSIDDHKGYINKHRANELGINIPIYLSNLIVVE